MKDNRHEQYVSDMEDKRGLSRKLAEGNFRAKQLLQAFRTQTIASNIFGIIFLASLIVSPFFFAHLFLDEFGEKWVAGVALGFCGTILTAIFSQIIWRNVNTRAAKKDPSAREQKAVVCIIIFIRTPFWCRRKLKYGKQKNFVCHL